MNQKQKKSVTAIIITAILVMIMSTAVVLADGGFDVTDSSGASGRKPAKNVTFATDGQRDGIR